MLSDTITNLHSLDLGYDPDPTAHVILHHAKTLPTKTPYGDPIYSIGHIERVVRREYPDTIEETVNLLYRAEMWGTSALVIDATGVGIPVVQAFRRHPRMKAAIELGGLILIPIMITSGGAITKKDGALHVPKTALVGVCHSILGQKRLRLAKGVKEGPTLMQEMKNFRYKITDSSNITYAGRDKTHDDILLATVLALWVAETFRGTEANVLSVAYS